MVHLCFYGRLKTVKEELIRWVPAHSPPGRCPSRLGGDANPGNRDPPPGPLPSRGEGRAIPAEALSLPRPPAIRVFPSIGSDR